MADIEAAAAGHAAGIPRVAADEGGELTMALARSSANQSPEAREALTEAARDRFAGQSQRGAQFIRNLTGGADATTTKSNCKPQREQPTSRPMESLCRGRGRRLVARARAAGRFRRGFDRHAVGGSQSQG